MELTTAEQPRKRVMDRTNSEARRAIKETLGHFNDWRLDIARFSALAERALEETTRCAILDRCAEIESQLIEARTDLILSLADASRKVAGHSRVVDVERALDNIELCVRQVRGKLAPGASASGVQPGTGGLA